MVYYSIMHYASTMCTYHATYVQQLLGIAEQLSIYLMNTNILEMCVRSVLELGLPYTFAFGEITYSKRVRKIRFCPHWWSKPQA